MRRTLEVIFRHPLQLLILIILLPGIGLGIAYLVVPKTYQSTASLWALHRYEIIGSTGSESNLQATPAETQTTALTELLQTRTFSLSVVKGIDIVPTLNLSSSVMANPKQLQDALFNEISKKVVVTSGGYNLFEISYINRDPQVAQKVVQAVVRTYGKQSLGLSVAEGQNLLASYQIQLQNAQQQSNNAVTAEEQYVASHPTLTPNTELSDPQYKQLDANRVQTQAIVEDIQNTMNTIQQAISAQGKAANSLYEIIDTPQIPTIAQSRSKSYLTGGGIGLGIALLADIIYLVILIRRDRAVYSAEDLEKITTFPIVMQLPTLTPTTVSLLTTGGIGDQSSLIGTENSSNGHAARS
jgi:uncharacterized protein involved in exopolysaccharide biosynthesis